VKLKNLNPNLLLNVWERKVDLEGALDRQERPSTTVKNVRIGYPAQRP
jgi:hypothetical protein